MESDIGTVLGIVLWVTGGVGIIVSALSRKKKAMLLTMVSTIVMLLGLVVLDYVGAL